MSQFNVSPSFTLELLERLAKVFKDYCGVLTEESIRKNFILIYELLDEMIVRPVLSFYSVEENERPCAHNAQHWTGILYAIVILTVFVHYAHRAVGLRLPSVNINGAT